MVGKQRICPLEDEFRGESVYAGCSRLREWTKNYVSSRIGKSNASVYDPASDSIPEEEPGYRTFCPYYLRSREGFELNGKVHFRRSSRALDVVEGLKKKVTPPSGLPDSCQGICPYEIMSLYAKNSDIVIMNYSHLFSPDFQDIIFQWLEMDSEKVTLIIDEAHNLGDAVRAMNSRLLTMRMVDLAREGGGKVRRHSGPGKARGDARGSFLEERGNQGHTDAASPSEDDFCRAARRGCRRERFCWMQIFSAPSFMMAWRILTKRYPTSQMSLWLSPI